MITTDSLMSVLPIFPFRISYNGNPSRLKALRPVKPGQESGGVPHQQSLEHPLVGMRREATCV